MFRLDRALQPYREAGSLNDRINLFGFIDDRVFLSKSGDVGVMLAVKGVDYESLAAAEIDNYTKRLESAFKIFDEKCRVYQYLFKRSGETVTPHTYENPVVNAAIQNRAEFLSSKAQDLYSLDIYYAVVMEGPQAQRAILATLAQAAREPRRAWREESVDENPQEREDCVLPHLQPKARFLHASKQSGFRHRCYKSYASFQRRNQAPISIRDGGGSSGSNESRQHGNLRRT